MARCCKVRFRTFVSRILVVSTVAFLAASSPLSSDSIAAEVTVQVGLRGHVKVGRWAAVRVVVASGGGEVKSVRVEAIDPLGHSVRFPLQKISAREETGQEYSGHFQIGRLDGIPRIVVERKNGTVESRKLRTDDAVNSDATEMQKPFPQSIVLVATLGKPVGFKTLGRIEESNRSKSAKAIARQEARRVRLLEYDSAGKLPSDVRGYDALDVMVITGKYGLNAKQDEALRRWVAQGGHLVVCRGSDLEAFVSEGQRRRSKNPAVKTEKRRKLVGEELLARWLPVTILGQVRLRDLTGLESFASRKSPIIFSGRIRSAKLADPQTSDVPSGLVLAKERYGPLIVRVPYGFGIVTFCGLDFDQPPVSTWRDVDAVGARILEQTMEKIRSRNRAGRVRISQSGTTDLGTQLHAIQEHFPSVHRLSSWKTIGLLVVYILLIGPIDYLLVHRVLKRPRLTWITFPLMVAVAAILCVNSAPALNGRELLLNQLDIIDIDATGEFGRADEPTGDRQLVRGQSWFTLYSPSSRRYSVRIEPAPYTIEKPSQQGRIGASRAICWSGINETVYGGMYRAGGLGLGQLDYTIRPDQLRMERLPVRLWSTRTLSAEWWSSVPRLVESRLRITKTRRLTGWLTHHFPVPIDDWIIVHSGMMYRFTGKETKSSPRSIPPNTKYLLTAARTGQVGLRDELTGARFRTEKRIDKSKLLTTRFEQAPYDPTGKDVMRWVRMVSFHRAAGGRTYSTLDNISLGRLDLSGLISLNRAVLIGRLRKPVSHILLSNGSGENEDRISPTRSDTIVRIVLPVYTGPAK